MHDATDRYMTFFLASIRIIKEEKRKEKRKRKREQKGGWKRGRKSTSQRQPVCSCNGYDGSENIGLSKATYPTYLPGKARAGKCHALAHKRQGVCASPLKADGR